MTIYCAGGGQLDEFPFFVMMSNTVKNMLECVSWCEVQFLSSGDS